MYPTTRYKEPILTVRLTSRFLWRYEYRTFIIHITCTVSFILNNKGWLFQKLPGGREGEITRFDLINHGMGLRRKHEWRVFRRGKYERKGTEKGSGWKRLSRRSIQYNGIDCIPLSLSLWFTQSILFVVTKGRRKSTFESWGRYHPRLILRVSQSYTWDWDYRDYTRVLETKGPG